MIKIYTIWQYWEANNRRYGLLSCTTCQGDFFFTGEKEIYQTQSGVGILGVDWGEIWRITIVHVCVWLTTTFILRARGSHKNMHIWKISRLDLLFFFFEREQENPSVSFLTNFFPSRSFTTSEKIHWSFDDFLRYFLGISEHRVRIHRPLAFMLSYLWKATPRRRERCLWTSKQRWERTCFEGKGEERETVFACTAIMGLELVLKDG